MLDAGVLVSVDRGEAAARALLVACDRSDVALRTTHAVVAQVWRDPRRQVRLGAALRSIEVIPLGHGRAVGLLLARSSSADVVDAHLVLEAQRSGDDVLTGDVEDLGRLAAALDGPRPTIRRWPPAA